MSNLFLRGLQSRSPRARTSRSCLFRIVALAALCFAGTVCAHAQLGAAPMRFRDVSALKPPAGARVAIIEFDDLECPACAEANRVLMRAAAQYKIPWIRHDFLIPYHQWSPVAAVNARWFDTKSKALGDAYRNAVFANQASIETRGDLQNLTQRFAQQHGTALPFVMDPQGKLAAEVRADAALGEKMGVHETPTAWVVTDHGYKQVTDFSKLYSMLDEAEAETK